MTKSRVALGLALWALAGCTPPMEPIGSVGPFSLTERSGKVVTDQDLRGKVWLAEFIFTTCRGVCPRMTAETASIRQKVEPSDELRWVSISVDPEADTPEALRAYADSYKAGEDWLFLTGDREAIYQLVRRDFMLGVAPSNNPEEPITHSTRMTLVDKQGRILAYYSHFEDGLLDQVRAGVDYALKE